MSAEAELLTIWRNADCPIKIERKGEATRITWGDDPLDFIDLSPRQIEQLAEQLRKARDDG